MNIAFFTRPKQDVIFVYSDSTVRQTLEKMHATGFTAVPVLDRDGVLTDRVCEEAEKLLLPLADAAKSYKLILTGHAHIDMNWMWSWQETVAVTLATFTTMCDIMDEYPRHSYEAVNNQTLLREEHLSAGVKENKQKRRSRYSRGVFFCL